MSNRILLGALLCLVASISWGAMFPVADAAFQYIDPFYFTIIRYGSVTLILIVILFFKEGIKAFRLEGKAFWLWFFGTMAFTVYNILIFWGQHMLEKEGIMIASIMESMMPMISIVLIWLLYRNRPHMVTIICVMIAFSGALLVITKGKFLSFFGAWEQVFPSLLILIAVIGWVIYTMGGERFVGWSALRYSTLSCLFGTVTALLIVGIFTLTGDIPLPTWQAVQTVSPHMLFMIIFPGAIALVGWNIGVSILSPLNGLLFINFVPVTTLAVSAIQGTTITAYDYIGAVFIIISLLSNNIFLRFQLRRHGIKKSDEKVQGEIQESII